MKEVLDSIDDIRFLFLCLTVTTQLSYSSVDFFLHLLHMKRRILVETLLAIYCGRFPSQ